MISDAGDSEGTMAASAVSEGAHGATSNGHATPSNVKSEPVSSSTPTFPPPKTDKPRPHVCGTCGRSFARLEHLKRHERSHTKEKPFECPQCNRCFARRDLLLRHQQKLHQSGAPSTRPRSGRRESTSGMPPTGTGRVRKNSVAGINTGTGMPPNGMRPRANTISHIDGSTLSMFASNASSEVRPTHVPTHAHHPSLNGHPGSIPFDYHAMSNGAGPHGPVHGLPKLNTQLNMSTGGLRTAPIGGLHDSYDLEKMYGSSSTINPAQLHFSGSFAHSASPFQPFPGAPPLEDDETIDWMAGVDQPMMFPGNEQAVDGSSPSAISTASQSGFSEAMVDGSNNPIHTSESGWQNTTMAPTTMINPVTFAQDPVFMDFTNPFNTVSPHELHEPGIANDFGTSKDFMSTPQAMPVLSPTAGVPGIPTQYFHPPMAIHSDSNSISSSSVNGSARHSSATSISTDSITDATRQALLMGLSQPLSLGFATRAPEPTPSLPSTADLQRFVSAFIKYFYPHMPFLHIPTLSFDSPTFHSHIHATNPGGYGHESVAGGGGCLIVAMAAIGALYEYEHSTAQALYEAAKKLIQVFLDARRRLGCSDAVNGGAPTPKAPLWLVQAMLLNLIYGHNCGDKMAANVSSVQCAALVRLLMDAGLTQPENHMAGDESLAQLAHVTLDGVAEFGDQGMHSEPWRRPSRFGDDQHAQWLRWKAQEERKRTFYSVFMLSSILTIAYNQHPRILNSEIRLDLPCDEDLWVAESAHAWAAMGGAAAAAQRSVSFADALSYLLNASQRPQPNGQRGPAMPTSDPTTGLPHDNLPDTDLRPSTFGCHILINALHVYIWETRQRHSGRRWKAQETEAMHAQIEPALKAWQAAWKSNPNHRLERAADPVFGPLAMDSIPLLDLAYVRLFVNLGSCKDACWERDFAAIVESVEHSADTAGPEPASPMSTSSTADPSADPTRTHARASNSPSSRIRSPSSGADLNGISDEAAVAATNQRSSSSPTPGLDPMMAPGQPKKRERLLRHAAFYAADSLSMSVTLNTTFADSSSRKLPLQTAICVFDCVQVLAEWAVSVQERIGPYLNVVLGSDDHHLDLLNQVPAMLLVEEEDVKLLDRIAGIVRGLETKMTLGGQQVVGELTSANLCGHAAKLLLVTAYMFDKAAVWSVTQLMAVVLEAHAQLMSRRAQASVQSSQTSSEGLQV